MLDHEKLDVYRLAIEFYGIALEILAQYPRGNASIADQFQRAALSIPLNIAEGVGKTRKADRARFYAIARGSAMESGAILDVSRVRKVVENGQYEEGKVLLERIVAMLSRMCR